MNTNFLFCNYIFISAFEDTLYDVYCNAYNTSKLLWEALDKKYKLEDVGTKKFLLGQFFGYKMIDTNLVW